MSSHDQHNSQRTAEEANSLLEAFGRSQALIEFEVDGTILTANHNFLDAVGYSLEQVQGKHHRMFCAPAYVNSPEYAVFWQQLRNGQFVAGEFMRLGKAGNEVHIQASYNPVKDSAGKTVRVVKIATNITGRKLQEKALSASQAVIEFDLSGKVITANANFLSAMGYELNDIIGQHHRIFCEPEFVNSQSYTQLWTRLNNGEPYTGELRRVKKGGGLIHLRGSYIPTYDNNGRLVKVIKYATDITAQKLVEAQAQKISCMVDNAPINIMMADLELNITFLNPASQKTLTSIEHLLPCKASEVLGKSVDIFHKNPSHQRRLLSNPRNLPHRAKFQLGTETLDLLATAIVDDKGTYLGPMVTWSVITDRVKVFKTLNETSTTLAASSAELSSSSQQMAAAAEQTISQSEAVAATTEQADRNAQVVASSTSEMASAIGEIARNMQKTREITGDAVRSAESTNIIIAKLGESSQKIGKVVKLITSIAQQTNLLALNATIEAARAGEAGKGFAVVANEVKELAKQTAKATDEIGAQIDAIQADTKTSVQAIADITKIIQQIATISATVASATEEQSSTTTDISRNVTQLASGTKDIGRNILSVTEAARSSGMVATGVRESAENLSKLAATLTDLVKQFEA
jgi:methyl-accepting chemotaxis protein